MQRLPRPRAAQPAGRPAAGKVWAILLAGGDGTRFRPLAERAGHPEIPKQFWSLDGKTSLLRLALRRAARLAPYGQTLAVLAAQHARWWQRDLADLPAGNLIVQPGNRGTAAGILLPLLVVLDRDPEAVVVLLPSDHFVEGEEALGRALRSATAAVQRGLGRIVLLGVRQEEADSGYGWILSARGAQPPLAEVERFVEKPDAETARGLHRQGNLVNTFIVVGAAQEFLALFRTHLPALLDSFCGVPLAAAQAPTLASLTALYASTSPIDFSRQVLEPGAARCSVLRVPDCGWTDLGTPERFAQCLARRTRVSCRVRLSCPAARPHLRRSL